MPISIDEFQQGNINDGSSNIVLDFLRSNRDQAFTQDEIIKGVNPNPTPESFIHFLSCNVFAPASGSRGNEGDING